MTKSTEGEQEDFQDPEQAILHQDGYRKVMFGEVSDPLIPPHPGAPEATEDDLTRAAMEDPAALRLDLPDPHPTLWRLVALIAFAVTALAIVFWWFR
jgi:hypothetical protein